MNGSMDATQATQAEQRSVTPADRATCWTIIHYLKHVEKNSKISEEELDGLSIHVGNAIMPEDLSIVEETINAHYPELIRNVRSNMWGSEYKKISDIFNK